MGISHEPDSLNVSLFSDAEGEGDAGPGLGLQLMGPVEDGGAKAPRSCSCYCMTKRELQTRLALILLGVKHTHTHTHARTSKHRKPPRLARFELALSTPGELMLGSGFGFLGGVLPGDGDDHAANPHVLEVLRLRCVALTTTMPILMMGYEGYDYDGGRCRCYCWCRWRLHSHCCRCSSKAFAADAADGCATMLLTEN